MMNKKLKNIGIGISNRHVHLSRKHANELFDDGYVLTKKRDLTQKGNYACEETLIIKGKEEISVRIVGGLRERTQVEILASDVPLLGIKTIERISGDLGGSGDVILKNGEKEVLVKECLIIASHHLHLSTKDAKTYGLLHKKTITLKTSKGTYFYNVPIRIADDYVTEFHINKDEASQLYINSKDTLDQVPDKEDVLGLVSLGDLSIIEKTAVIGYYPSVESGGNFRNSLTIGSSSHLCRNSLIYTGSTIGRYFKARPFSVVRENCQLGYSVDVGTHSIIDDECTIGNNVKIHRSVYICQRTTIEDGVFIAPHVTFLNDHHPICMKHYKGATVKHGVRIGGNSTILPNVTIGENSLIGAGSVVTKNIPANVVAYGNPAKVVMKIGDFNKKVRDTFGSCE